MSARASVNDLRLAVTVLNAAADRAEEESDSEALRRVAEHLECTAAARSRVRQVGR